MAENPSLIAVTIAMIVKMIKGHFKVSPKVSAYYCPIKEGIEKPDYHHHHLPT